MPLSFVAHRHQQCRIRHVNDFIGANLDADITLDGLAEVAHLNAAHLVRAYSQAVGESPMQAVRRLRLKRAFDDIGQGRFGRITDVGFAAGYGSSAAFTRAFHKQFGLAPTDVPLLLPNMQTPPPLRLDYIPARKVWQFDYEGAYSQNGYYKARMMWLCHVAERPELLSWRVNDRDNPFSERGRQQVKVTHFMPVSDPSMSLQEADLVTHPAHLYAVIVVSPYDRDELLATLGERVQHELGCELAEGCTLDRDVHDRGLRAPQERLVEVYVPVAPRSAYGEQLAAMAEEMARRKF